MTPLLPLPKSKIVSSTPALWMFREPQSLYGKLGGIKSLRPLVLKFYTKVFTDKELAPFFEGVDMQKLMAKQVR